MEAAGELDQVWLNTTAPETVSMDSILFIYL